MRSFFFPLRTLRWLLFLYMGIFLFPWTVSAQGTEFFEDPEEPTVPTPKVRTPPPTIRSVVVPAKKKIVRQPKKRSNSDIIFLMDISGSMDSFLDKQEISKLKAAKEALIYFAKNMKEGARFQLWTFSGQITQHVGSKDEGSKTAGFEPIGSPNSATRQQLVKTVETVKTRGGTKLYEAVYKAVGYFHSTAYSNRSREQRQKIVLILADGEDDDLSPIKLKHVLEQRSASKITIRTIGIGITKNTSLHRVLCQLATDNKCTITHDIETLKKILHSFTES